MKPIDHHPYLTDGDLRTPEDVLAWLREWDATGWDPERHYASEHLSERLDRERRQACRRGARDMARSIAVRKRWLRRDYDEDGGREKFGNFARCMAHMREARWGHELHLALAFRAAARAR